MKPHLLFALLVIPAFAQNAGKISILAGNGQLIFSNSFTPLPMLVKVTDSAGNPLPNAPVSWSLVTGSGRLFRTDDITDRNGISSNNYSGPLLFGFNAPPDRASIRATSSFGSVTFSHVAIALFFNPGGPLDTASTPGLIQLAPVGHPAIVGAAGTTLTKAFQFKLTYPLGPFLLQGIPGLGIEAYATLLEDGPVEQTATCVSPELSGNDGILTCDLALGGKVGTSIVRVYVGGRVAYESPLTVTQGPARTISIVSGNRQSANWGQALPAALLARIDDGLGGFVNGVPVSWTVVSGSATLFEQVNISSGSGLVSTGVRVGATPGEVRIRAAISSTVFVDFTASSVSRIATITKLDGDQQSASAGSAFAIPLVVIVKDSSGVMVQGAPVTFSATSGVTLVTPTVLTDAAGVALANVFAGRVAGSYSVTAAVDSVSAVFNLTVTPPGPSITSIVNNASFLPGLSPCAIAQLVGKGFASAITGSLIGTPVDGKLPTVLEGISIEIAGIPTPLYSVSNINGHETAAFQVPCEQPPGPASLRLRAGSDSITQPVTIAPYAPGIFQTLDSTGRAIAVAVKADGSYLSAENPAERDEELRVFVTGLGQTAPRIDTNVAGTGTQQVNAAVIVGVNNEGISARMEDTIYAPGLTGVYIVTFHMPANTAPGKDRPFVIAVQAPDGTFTYSQPAIIDIR